MTPGLQTRRRALLIVYGRYLRADRAWRAAQTEAMSWFPLNMRSSVPPIGDPGSPLRRLYDCRAKTLAQLTAAHRKLNEARRRSPSRIEILGLPTP